jgi:hypothetical protein
MAWMDWFRRRDPVLDESVARIDAALRRARAGLEVTDRVLADAGAAFDALYEALSRAHGTEDNRRFEGDRLFFYENALKLAALEHASHDAWPFRSDIRGLLADDVRRALARRDDAWLRLTAIQPLLLDGDVTGARRCLEALAGDPFAHEQIGRAHV